MRPSADETPGAAGTPPQPMRGAQQDGRGPQPWSAEARASRQQRASAPPARRGDLTRFRAGLSAMIVREQEEEERMLGFAGAVLKWTWVPLVYTAAVVVQDLLGVTSFSVDELAAGFAASVTAGLLLHRLWRTTHGHDTMVDDGRYDAHAPQTVAAEFPTISPRDDAPACDDSDAPGDDAASGEGDCGGSE